MADWWESSHQGLMEAAGGERQGTNHKDCQFQYQTIASASHLFTHNKKSPAQQVGQHHFSASLVPKKTHCSPAESLFPGVCFRSLTITSSRRASFLLNPCVCLSLSVFCLCLSFSLTHTSLFTGSTGNPPLASEEYPSLSYSSGPAQSRSDQWGFKRAAEKATIALWPLAVQTPT